MIGAGMLAAPARVYAIAHGWSFWVLAAAAAALTPLILCFADLGSRFSATGGPYLYARATLPGWLAFAVGWLLWISQALAVATLANLLVAYVSGFAPGLATGAGRVGVILALAVGMTVLVLVGIRQSASASNVLAVVKITFVIGFLAAGIAFVQPERLVIGGPPPSPIGFAQALLIYLFAYTGFERGAVLAGEARDPQRDVPWSLFAAVVLVTAAYAAVLLVCVGVLDAPAATDRPLAEVGRELFGALGQAVVSAGAIAVILGTILVVIVSMPRLLLALAEQGQLPKSLAAIHPRWRTPHRAILISAVLAFGSALASDLLGSLTFSTAARIMAYLLCCVALLRLAGRADAPTPGFRLPAPRATALAAIAIFTAVLVLGAVKEITALVGATAVGLAVYALSRRGLSPDPRNSP